MGIAVRELLSLDYFKEFYVVAGKNGLNKEVQGVSVLEAPDATRWSQGKELILSSGYVLAKEPDCIRNAFAAGNLQGASAFMIKRDRYLDRIPEELEELFEEHDIPLISMPYQIPWMELMSQISTAVMNRTIRRFRISGYHHAVQPANQSYKVQKIRRILQAVESEMSFPAFLYDLEEECSYYSSSHFKTITESFGLREEDYWRPSRPYTRHTLCDYINMTRYRLLEQKGADGARISWIMIPIVMDGATRAYFVVMESREFIDYYDEFALRIAFLMLQGIYEQIMVVRNIGNVGFENFIHYALHYSEEDSKKLVYQANMQGISMNVSYIYAVFRQMNEDLSARNERKNFIDIFLKSSICKNGQMVFLDENEGLLLISEEQFDRKDRGTLQRVLEDFAVRAAQGCGGMELHFGVCCEGRTLKELCAGVEKCRKTLKMGQLLYPGKTVCFYEMLGPLAWMQIPQDELESLLSKYRALLMDEKNAELLRTLRIYLENNMNYSVTAEKMYVHINTIRKRIEKLREILTIDWDSYVERMQTALLLEFLNP